MKRQRLVFLLSLTVLFLSFLAGCANPAKEVVPTEKIAIIDLNKVLQAHRLHSAWEMAVANEVATQKLKDQQIEMTRQQAVLIDKMQDLQQTGRASFYQADFAIKMSEAHLAERERLKEFEFKEKRRIDEYMKERYAAIEEEYKLPLFNLKMKIESIKPLPYSREQAEAEKKQLIEQLAALQTEKNDKLNALHQESAQLLLEAMQMHEQESRERLSETAKNLSSQMSALQRDKLAVQRQMLANIPQTFDKTMASLEKQLLEQKLAKDKIYSRMYSEISSQVTKLALQKQISVVLTGVKVNVQAEDITDEVIAALPAK